MQKVKIILWIFIFINGCSIIRKNSGTEKVIKEEVYDNNFLNNVEKQNITKSNFFIQKAEVQLIDETVEQKFLASIKFVFPDRYLISLKSRTGIEAARIFLTDDTVLINDRINRKLYFGKPGELIRKYSIPAKALPLVFGDFIKGNINEDYKVFCSDEKAELDCDVSGIRINYVFDCDKKKIVSATQESSLNTGDAFIEYEAFAKENNDLIPTKIRLTYGKSIINIKILKIEIPWNGSIEFIPGSRYELIKLL